MKYFLRFSFFIFLFQIQLVYSEEDLFGSTIDKVNFFGLRKVESQALLEKMNSVPGSTLRREVIQKDIKSIYQLKFFNQVEFYSNVVDGKLNLNIVVEERPRIRSIKFEGNLEEDEDELKKQIKTKPFTLLDISSLNADVRSLQKYYEDKGYYLILVNHEVVNTTKESVDVIFKVKENLQVKVKQIKIIGNRALRTEELKALMQTQEDGLLPGSGSYRDFYFQSDIERLTYYYRTKGYLQVNISNPLATVSDDKKWIFITFQVAEGPQFTVDSINFSGDLLFSDDELRAKLELLPEQIYNEEILRKDILTLTETYQDEGYAFTNVIRTLEPVEGKNRVKINFSFEKGEKAYLGKISVKGNTKTRDKVIRRELEIYEGMLYSGSKMRISKENVNRLGFFDKDGVNFNSSSPKGTNNIVDVDIVIKERQTGQISVGAGYSSGSKGFFQASVRQSNFRGLGQDLNFSLNLASNSQTYTLGFTEPYFLDSKWSLGGTIYRTVSTADISSFNYKKQGFDVRVGHPIWDNTRGYLTYSYRDTQVSDVTVATINQEDESGIASGIEGTIILDKRNNSFEPSKGYYASTSLEYVGVGGDFNWLRQEAEGRYFKELFGDLVFRSRLRLAQFYLTSDRKIPRTERFSMGGPRNMRGFGLEDIGPVDRLELKASPGKYGYFNVGGLGEVLGTLELEHPLIEEAGLKWVLFYDTGNAYRKYIGYKSDYSLRSDYGLGMRWFSPIGILRFELGFPINRRPSESANEFIFDIGQIF